jgi:hypothetical protein
MRNHRGRIGLACVLTIAASGALATDRLSPQWCLAFDDAPGQFNATRLTHISASVQSIGIALLRSAGTVTPLGVRRWHVNVLEDCVAPLRSFVNTLEMLSDGESWVLRSCAATSMTVRRDELLRLDADGNVLVVTDLGALSAPTSYARLLPEPNGVVALIPLNNGLRWLRVSTNGAVIDDAFTELIGPDRTVTITNVRLWPNGSASVATRQSISCAISPPSVCPRPASTLLRLNTDGTERWRVEAGEAPPFIGFNDDGSSLIVESQGYEPLRLRQVSATGVPGSAFIAADGEHLYLSGAAGPVRGHFLAYSESDEQLLLDRNGHVLARRSSAGTASGTGLAHGNLGFVTSAWRSDAALVSADDLSVIAEFDVDGIDNTTWSDEQWALLDDGSVYSSTCQIDDYAVPNRACLARFAVPGTPAADLIFIDHFE